MINNPNILELSKGNFSEIGRQWFDNSLSLS